MNPIKKKHFYILYSSLAICLLICFDVYICPVKSRQEIITDRYTLSAYAGSAGHSGVYGSSYLKYYIITDKSKYLITPDLSQKIEADSSIIVGRSLLTNTRRKISYNFRGNQYETNINVLSLGGMIFFIIVTIAGICLSLIFYDYIAYVPGRGSLVIFWSILSVGLLLVYILMNVFYFDIFF